MSHKLSLSNIEKKMSLESFLSKHRLIDKSTTITHLGMGTTSGKFNIPDDELPLFYKLYSEACFKDNLEVSLIETHKQFGPIIYDIDFKYENDNNKRIYDEGFMEQFLLCLMNIIDKHLNVNEKETRFLYVLEKPTPTFIKKNEDDSSIWKDGFHVIAPKIITDPTAQKIIRNEFLEEFRILVSEHISFSLLNSIEDIVDESVIERNGWMMFGSCKPGQPRYNLTSIWDMDKKNFHKCTIQEQPEMYSSDYWKKQNVVTYLSIRSATVGDVTQHTEYGGFELQKWKTLQKEKVTSIINKETGQAMKYYDDLPYVEGLVQLLEPTRADSYVSWIELGWCLHNIDGRLLDCWINFSKLSEKYKDEAEESCRSQWNTMKNDGLSIGTLHMWVHEDNPDKYMEYRKTSCDYLITQCCLKYFSSSESSDDKKDDDKDDTPKKKGQPKKASWPQIVYYVVKVLYKLYGHQFVCSSHQKKIWWEFKNHRWQISELGLRPYLSDEVFNYFQNAGTRFYMQQASSDEAIQKERNGRLGRACHEIADHMRNPYSKRLVMEEAMEHFFWTGDGEQGNVFDEILDSNCYLIGMENGVYDLKHLKFRTGRCDDFVRMTTKNNYQEYTKRDEEVEKEIMDFFKQVLPNPDIMHYVLTLLASLCDGEIQEHFHIWVGSGGNGKSKIIDLFQYAMGEYCGNLPVSALTSNRPQSNSATPEFERLKGKRFVFVQEPEKQERLQAGRLKELTGGDTIYARGLHKEPIEFKPQFGMILASNVLPKVPADDGGIWRRMRVVRFRSKFVEDPDPEDENEFPIDVHLKDKLWEWRKPFFNILMKYYKVYRNGCPELGIKPGLSVPKEIIDETTKYRSRNDHISEFIEDCLELNKKGCVLSIQDLYFKFTMWCKTSSIPLIEKDELQEYMENRFGEINKYGSEKGWKDMTIKEKTSTGDVIDY